MSDQLNLDVVFTKDIHLDLLESAKDIHKSYTSWTEYFQYPTCSSISIILHSGQVSLAIKVGTLINKEV